MSALIVPYLPDGGARDANWTFCRARFAALHPDLDIIEATTEPWSKTEAVNRAVANCDHDVFVLCDADLVVDRVALDRALVLARTGWAVPHGMVYRLDAERTVNVLDGPLDVTPHDDVPAKHLTRPAYYGRAGGGVICLTRWAWNAVGGFDERFAAWGGEDVSLGWALRAIIGPGLRVGGPLWHLWHPQQSMYRDSRLRDNLALSNRYRIAARSPSGMREILAERPPSV